MSKVKYKKPASPFLYSSASHSFFGFILDYSLRERLASNLTIHKTIRFPKLSRVFALS
jgi:hypothetical protein